MSSEINGILLVDKPVGISSFGVVAKVRGIWRQQLREQGISPKKAKIGHTGTLDPAASGLMILVLGSYTKRASEFSKLDKVYEVKATLGATSSTGDSEGEITSKSSKQPTVEQVEEATNKFKGEIMQLPPIYSAIKVDGRRAYKLARAGKEVVLEPRPVTIHSLANIEYDYPALKFTAHVGSGTYIRSLVEDIGAELGTGAYLSGLKRVKVGEYNLQDALTTEDLNYDKLLSAIKS